MQTTATDSPHPRDSLEAAVCHDLGTSRGVTEEIMARASLGPAASNRFVLINSGRVGRSVLLSMLESSRRVLDSDLDKPAPWRGASRHALAAGRRENTPWLSPAFTEVADMADAASGDICSDDLLRWNLTSGGPGEWRTRAMRVDGYDVRISAERSVDLVQELLDRANQRTEPAPLAAARLHLGLLLVHPFRDGNGRTARMAAAAVLIRDGTRSSLLTCVEQHHHLAPGHYPSLMGRLRQTAIGADRVIDGFLGAMAGRSILATWIRQRHQALIKLAGELGHDDPVEAVRCFEFGNCPSPISTHGGQPLEAWHLLRPQIHSNIASELRSQLARMVGDD